MPSISNGLEVHHEVDVVGAIGSLQLRFASHFHAPWTVLFGPSGCGKSTVLRAMCGLAAGLDVRFHRFANEGKTVCLQDRGLWVAPQLRRLGYAPQSAGLFPHLSVEKNVSFGARVRARQVENRTRIEGVLELLRLSDVRNRLPRELSGGERQRVSLARALAVPDSCLLLLDEPFAGIDRALRDLLLPDIQHWAKQRGVPVISVTHDVDEVFLLQADVVRLREGEVVAHGRPEDVLADEAARMKKALASRA